MTTIIKIRPAEFDNDFIRYLKKIVVNSNATEIVIEVKETAGQA